MGSLQITFKALELDEMKEGDEIQTYLAKKTGQRTVPNIFIKTKHVGGCDDLHSKHNSGKLLEMLQ